MGLTGSVVFSFVSNYLIVLVGRIWVLARAARRVFGAQMASAYYTVCAMMYVCISGIWSLLLNLGILAWNQAPSTCAVELPL